MFDASADIIAAVEALTDCASRLENEPLKGTVASATRTLVGAIEGHCRELVRGLLEGLRQSGDSAEVAHDKVWTLRLMGKRSEATRRWILDAGGMEAVWQAMAAHPGHEELQKEGAWLVYVLHGVDGFRMLLQTGRDRPAVLRAVAWAVYDLASTRPSPLDWPEAEDLVLGFLEGLKQSLASLELLWACCSALRFLIDSMPCRGTTFVKNGGAKAVLDALAVGREAGPDGESVLVAGMQLINALVEGNAFAAQCLRSLGALDCLVAYGLCLPGKVMDQTMWTLGQVGGVLAVLQVMSRAGDSGICSAGLAAMSKLAWMSERLEDTFQQQLPQAAEALVPLSRRVAAERPAEDLVYTLEALGGVLHDLTPQMPPGSSQVLDSGVAMLIDAVAPQCHELVAQAGVASIGHIAMTSPPWRGPLRAVMPHMALRMREPSEREENMKHQKSLFWASAAISGLPVVLDQMASQPNSPNVQDAGISAIMDLLEDPADQVGDRPAVAKVDSLVEPQHVPKAIETIVGAMKLHRSQVRIQWFGCLALGQLHGCMESGAEVPPEVIDSALAALRWHPEEYKVVGGACRALRTFVEPRSGRESASSLAVSTRVLAALQGRDASASLCKSLERFRSFTDKEMLEDAIYALAVIDGIPTALKALEACEGKYRCLCSAGIGALFELCRTFPRLQGAHREEIQRVLGAIVVEVRTACEAAAAGGGVIAPDEEAEVADLVRRAELLGGLLTQGV
jgi:hypothetical protein